MGYWMERAKQLHKTEQHAASSALVPGSLITWQRTDAKRRGPTTIDFVHTDPDGSTWAFVTLPDGWAAVNAGQVTKIKEGDRTL